MHVAHEMPPSFFAKTVCGACLQEHKIKILIRRAGPNYLEGLRKVKAASDKLGLGIKAPQFRMAPFPKSPEAQALNHVKPSLSLRVCRCMARRPTSRQ